MDKRYFSQKIVKWYQANKRILPWRETKDPYKIWLSEIILQQTRVAQGLPYYERFVKKYKTVGALARAEQQDILRLWQGLGYYTRARNLHKCARAVIDLHKGKFPTTFGELQALPGIGGYTAAAIASFSSGEPVAVVDGNVYRVLSRIFGIETPINSLEGKNLFLKLANDLIDPDLPDEHNQAIMEFGATQCVPKNPKCPECIFKKSCFAHQNALMQVLPVKIKRKESRKRYFYYLVFEKGNSIIMKKREGRDIWNGLYDFPLLEKNRPLREDNVLKECDLLAPKMATTFSKSYKHVLTHQTIFAKFVVVKLAKSSEKKEKEEAFYSLNEINKLPKPVLVSRFLNDHYLL